jgi:putative RecB family exonuclease
MKPLSYSQISAYQQCPLSYRLQYIDGLEPKAKWYFSLGETLHKCAEHFFTAKPPTFPSLKDFLDFYRENWSSEGWESPDQEAAERAHGERTLREFWRIHSHDFKVPLATERLFVVDIDGVTLTGYVDRIDKLDTGGLSIVDYKSNRDLFTKQYVEKQLQLTLYQIACEQMWDMPVERLTLYHLRSNTPVSCGPHKGKKLTEARRLVVSTAEDIEAGLFPATENQYCPCDFPEYCPYYKHQYGEPIPDTAKPSDLKGVAIDGVVERYVSLQEEKARIEKNIEELKELLIRYCDVEGVNRVFGSNHAISYRVVEKTGYDEEKVRPVLEAVGLWDRGLRFDPAALKGLLADDTVPEKVKSRITALAEVVSTYSQLRTRTLKEDVAE